LSSHAGRFTLFRACCAALLAAALLTFGAAGTASAASTADDGDTPSVETVKAAQRALGVRADGVVGPKTRRALGRFARHRLGQRQLHIGNKGWDVASLQFRLAEHGFPSADFDGIFGAHIDAALRKFQKWAGLEVDGVAGPATLKALGGPLQSVPLPLAWPLTRPVLGDPFGPRGNRWHTGIDLPAPLGTAVYAARSGEVVWSGWRDGYGLLVTVAHGHGERSMYAHLSRIDVRVGVWIGAGVRVGLIGATGDATGPHLHFEVRVRGAAVDPLRALPH
jgi:murein DD-endopeptidase MepM/ murein hydrolase activator NlpD